MDQRQQALEQWLARDCQLASYQLQPMAGDASFRRYFRLRQGSESYVVMDAPPPTENCQPFVSIAAALSASHVCVPEVFASDLKQGFLLLTDFGDQVYLKELQAGNANQLYGTALDALAKVQSCRAVVDWKLPRFNEDFIYQELQVFKEWFLLKHLGLALSPQQETMLANFFHFLANSAATQSQVFMHRDYHSANLMQLSDNRVGVLDFQDAFIGPVTYDLVSLLRDCYIDWPEHDVYQWVLQYKEKIGTAAPVSEEVFIRWFDLMGLQRHLKALLTFSRKFHRDGSSHYLQYIPRTLNYVVAVAPRYPEVAAFNEFLTETIVPQTQKVMACEQ